MLFQEQGIMIASMLMAIGMAISVLVEALLPTGGETYGTAGKPPPTQSKLKALALLLRRLGMKSAEALPGVIGVIISWTLTRAAEVVGWVSQTVWALVVGVRGLLYTWSPKSKTLYYDLW